MSNLTTDAEKAPVSQDPSKRSSSVDLPSELEKSSGDATVADAGEDHEYLHGTRLVVVAVSMMLSMFLISLDNVCWGRYVFHEPHCLPHVDHRRHCNPENHG